MNRPSVWRRTGLRDGVSLAEPGRLMTTELKELDLAALSSDLPEYGLVAGDVGTVVLVHDSGKGFEVEFITGDGSTIAVVTLRASQMRPMGGRQILHVRDLRIA
jgi:hypothetical protein